MASYFSPSPNHCGENGNILSINTDRVRPQDVLAVRGSPSPDRHFDPTAPVFVNSQGSAHNHSAAPEISMSPQGYNPAENTQNSAHSYTTSPRMNMLSQGFSPAEYTANSADYRHIRAVQDQNMAVHEQDHLSYGHNLPHLSGAMRPPRPNLISGPIQSPPVLARPRSAALQHSPPHRSYHEPITVSHANESTQATIHPSRADFLYSRLEQVDKLKKQYKNSFVDGTKRLVALEKNLESLQLGGNDRLPELYQSEFEYRDTDRVKDEDGRMYKRLEKEIEELLADLMVPHEAREEDNCQVFEGE